MTFAYNTSLKIKNNAIRESAVNLVLQVEKMTEFDNKADKEYRDLLKNSTVLLLRAVDFFIWGYLHGDYDYYKSMKECVDKVVTNLKEMKQLEQEMTWFNEDLAHKIGEELGQEDKESGDVLDKLLGGD